MPPNTEERRHRVLVVDDQREMAETLADGLAGRDFDATAATTGSDAVQRLQHDDPGYDALVTDLRMSPMDGLALLAASRANDPARPVIVMTAFGAIDTAVESIRRGASHYLVKPFKLDELVIFLRRALDERAVRREAHALRQALGAAPRGMIGGCASMRDVFDRIARVADADVPVLVLGETGTGKGLVAVALHTQGRRAQGPFVTVNCAALPETLLESELFGHVKGAFTGAGNAREGLFAQADGGTLFLDEIGEMTPALQAKLLDVLERGVVRPLGASRERSVDVRIVAATHRDLRDMTARGAFREDLLYRLDVVAVELPALRHRTEDLPPLLDHFLRAARAKHPRSPARRFAPDAAAQLLAYPWPGNIRELAHVIERGVLLARDADISLQDLPPLTRSSVASEGGPLPFSGEVRPVREVTRAYAAWALDRLGGSRTRTAERLGIDGKTLARWLDGDRTDTEPTGRS